MGAFPEDYEIRVSRLIKLWVAEGFLKPSISKSSDEVAVEYFQDLIDRNLILVRQRGSNGKTKSCSIHDLLRDLCVRESHREKFLCVIKKSPDRINGQRRLIIHGNYLKAHDPSPSLSTAINVSWRAVSAARSFLGTGRFDNDSISSLFRGFKLLRVLDVAEVDFRLFPEEVLELYNLYYLAFTSEAKLPSSISVLENLQTLIVRQKVLSCLFNLPPEIWEMPQLKHLCFTRCVLPDPPRALVVEGAVLSLPKSFETLSVVRDFKCTEENLEMIQNVKKLGLNYEYIASSGQWSCYYLNNLDRLHNLENLKCLFGVSNCFSYSPRNFPPKLTFPPNLKKLTLYGSGLPWEDMMLIGSLPKLEVLKLKDAFTGSVWEPIEGEFLKLKYLKMENMDLVEWRADETHFPSLQRLILKRCYWLEEIPSAIGEIPTLQLIQLDDCSHEVVTSANNLKEEQESLGNDGLEVRISSTKGKTYRRRVAPSQESEGALFEQMRQRIARERISEMLSNDKARRDA